jgi:hypothetical protein
VFSVGVACTFLCVSVRGERPSDELITRQKSPTDFLDLVTEVKRKMFHGGGQGLNWAVEPKENRNLTDWYWYSVIKTVQVISNKLIGSAAC